VTSRYTPQDFSSAAPTQVSQFFIETPPSYNNSLSSPGSLESRSKTYATGAGFAYVSEYHRLSREILLDYIPPTLRIVVEELALREAESEAIALASKEAPNSMPVPPPRKCQPGSGEALELLGLRLDQHLPPPYKKRILATAIACQIVYKEGIKFLEILGIPSEEAEESATPMPRSETSTSLLGFMSSASLAPNQWQNGNVPSLATTFQPELRKWTQHVASRSYKYLMEACKVAELIRQVNVAAGLESVVRQRIIGLLESGGTRIGVELDGLI
jgi:hypothetical protein